MKILPINNAYQNYNNSFKAKPNQSVLSKCANKALLPTAICAYIMSPLLGALNQTKAEVEVQMEQTVNNNNIIQYEKDFVLDNQDYTMSYVNTSIDFGKNAVSEIYFTPKNSTQTPMRLEKLIKYSYGDEYYDLSAIVSKEDSDKTEEIILPEEISKELLDLYDGKTDLFLIPGFNTYSEILCNLLD